MDIGDIFRSFFGLRERGRRIPVPAPDNNYNHTYNDPTVAGDDGDGADEDGLSGFPFFHGSGGSSLDDMFHHFHHDMHSQMESLHRQMEDMMKEFGTITSEHIPPVIEPGILDMPDSHRDQRGDRWFFNFGPPEKSSPRDFMLKEDDTKNPENLPSLPAPSPEDSNIFGFSFKKTFGLFPRNPSSQDQSKDTDLDGKVNSANVMDIIEHVEKEGKSQNLPSNEFFSRTTVSMSTMRGPDGTTEHKKVVKDSSGREESTFSRSVDGQSHIVTTVTGPNGLEERRENFRNMDENDISKFEEKWRSHQAPQRPFKHSTLVPSTRLDSSDMDIFSRFFNDPPK